MGVLRATDPHTSARRLATFQVAQQFAPIPIDEDVSDAWAYLVAQLRANSRKAPVNDTWIAATAIAHDIPLFTQDADYAHMPDLKVVSV